MGKLNYHHLYYFWHVAQKGNLTKAAADLHVSQSALSAQIKQLEHTMGVELFIREGRKLVLSEVGRRTFAYAEDIFNKGEELESLLLTGAQPENPRIRIGMLSTMSRNFIESFIEPLINNDQRKFSLHARGQMNLLNELANHQLDLALTNIEVQGSNEQLWQCQLLARQPIGIVGPPGTTKGKNFLQHYQEQNWDQQKNWVLPVVQSPVRSAFDSFCAYNQLKPNIIAEVNDMAMLRLLARDSGALAVIPDVVVKDELNTGKLEHLMTLPNGYENFYAVTVKRQFLNPVITELISDWLLDISDLGGTCDTPVK